MGGDSITFKKEGHVNKMNFKIYSNNNGSKLTRELPEVESLEIV